MCATFDIAKETISKFIEKKEPFTYAEIQKKIVDNKGVLRVAVGRTIGDALRSLEKRDVIYYDEPTEKFYFNENLKELKEAYFQKISNFNLT